jgi:iron complex outermembrane receptor protein
VAQVDQGTASSDSSVKSNVDNKSSSSQSNDDGKGLAEILVQGSRILNVDVTRTKDDPQPYYILDSEQIQQSGAVNVEDFLKQRLTMNTSSYTSSQFASQAGASSNIDLRGLGANETLILVDGRRSASVTLAGTATQPDINGIPLSAIERIEVLPSSASAIYGGAAMGGVVNIILKKNYEGGEFGYTYDNVFRGHAPINTVNGTYGLTLEGGKTRVMLSGQYSDATTLLVRDRPEISDQGYAGILARDPSFFSYGPSNPILGATPNIGAADGQSNLTFKGTGVSLGSPIATIASGAAAATPSTVIPGHWNTAQAPTGQNFGLLQPLGSAPLKKSLMASIRRDLTSSLEAFTEFSTQSNSTTTSFNPFYNPIIVPASAATNPFNQDVQINFPNNATAPFRTDSVTNSLTTGLIARLPGEWSAELDYTWSRNSFEDSYVDSYDATTLGAAIANGSLNPFVDTLAHPLDLNPYLTPTHYSGDSTLNDLGLRASGPLWTLPWGRPTLTVGLEHRKDGSHNSEFDTTDPLAPGSDQRQVYFGQVQSTSSIYAEARIPVVTAKNAMPLIQSVELQLAGRSERYTVSARTPFANLGPDGSILAGSPPQGVKQEIDYTSSNPTIGLKYKPLTDVTLRASYAKAFLPPTAAEFLPNPLNNYTTTIVDPANGKSYQILVVQGGAPDLKPQTAIDWDFGLIFEPQEPILQGLRVDIEYYRIKQPNYITTPAPQDILANPAYANRITRDPATGLITSVDTAYLNAINFKTSGWDLSIDYRKPTTVGLFGLHAVATLIDHDLRQYEVGGPTFEYAGFPSELGEAKVKASATFSWAFHKWLLAWTTTYFGTYQQGIGSPDSPFALQYGGPYTLFSMAQGGYSIPSQTYHDIFVSYDLDKIPGHFLSGLKVQAGIKNLFNKVPPLDVNNSPYFYSTYGDPRLRDYYIGISARL